MKVTLIFLVVCAVATAYVVPPLPTNLPEINAEEAELLQKIMQNPSMMKLMTHPKTMEAMEEIAIEAQAAPQQTEDRCLLLLWLLLAQALTSASG